MLIDEGHWNLHSLRLGLTCVLGAFNMVVCLTGWGQFGVEVLASPGQVGRLVVVLGI